MPDNISFDAKILIIDDQETNLHLLKSLLKRSGYNNIVAISDPREALYSFTMLQPDIIMLDLMMPYLSGFEVMELLKLQVDPDDYMPIIVLTADVTSGAKHRALTAGAQDFLTKPLDTAEVLLRVNNLLRTRFLHLMLAEQKHKLEETVAERTAELHAAHIEVLERLAIAAEYRDDQTGQHIRRVSTTSVLLSQTLGMADGALELIRRASELHDVGKIGIPDDILLKPGKLTTSEFGVMKTHTTIGARILSGAHSDLVRMASSVAYTHHERWDGTGYPCGLCEEAIPLEGRIVAIADVFDALTHSRPYKEAWPLEKALAEIKSQSGRQFDPIVVEAFFDVHEQALLPPPAASQVRRKTMRTTRLLNLECNTEVLK